MPNDFNNDQLDRLKRLGIEIGSDNISRNITCLSRKNNGVLILAGASVISLVGFGGLMALKGSAKEAGKTVLKEKNVAELGARTTPVNHNIQKYLLSSQQYLSQAIQSQTNGDTKEMLDFLNRSIEEVNMAISNFPKDYRGYQQRGKIYQSLSGDDQSFLKLAVADFSTAYKQNPDVAEISRDLASLYATVGDATKTIFYLSEAIRIEPTKAQNFYDLAKIQSQKGDFRQALETYKQLIWLVSDSSQKKLLEEEKQSLEKILADNPDLNKSESIKMPTPAKSILGDGDRLEANIPGGVKIALGEKKDSVEVVGLTNSNALSGEGKLLANALEVEISNDNLGDNSQVYVTKTLGGKNQTLRVKSKTKTSFRIGIDTPVNEDIEFKWWIIN